MVLLAAACVSDDTRYSQALEQLEALEMRVDTGFSAARAHNPVILAADAWETPDALKDALAAAAEAMAGTVVDQEARIAHEASILEFEFLTGSPDTRVIYLMDLDAQRAKLAIFNVTLEMYQVLKKEVDGGTRSGFEELARTYSAGIEAANHRYQGLDLARQRKQGVPEPGSGI